MSVSKHTAINQSSLDCVPVLLIGFNRPQTTLRVFERIAAAKPARLYFAVDGPRTSRPGEGEIVEEVRGIISRVDWECDVKTRFSETNQGCRIGVSSAITWFFEHEEAGIILEDDCLPEQGFFEFITSMLRRYREDERVMMVSGTNYLFFSEQTGYDAFFSRYYSIWGWGTWRRAWSLYDAEMKEYQSLKSSGWLEGQFSDPGIVRGYYDMFDAVYSQRIDTWDLQWVYTCLHNSGLSLTSVLNQVSNIGFVGSHASGDRTPFHEMPVKSLPPGPYLLPPSVSTDPRLESATFRTVGMSTLDKPVSSDLRSWDFVESLRNVAKSFRRRFLVRDQVANPDFVRVAPLRPKRGNALVSYIKGAASQNPKHLQGHTNLWECWCIVNLLADFGYEVDVIDWDNFHFVPTKDYDLVFDIHRNLDRLEPYLSNNTVRLLHLTGSNPHYSVRRELERVEELEKRTGKRYSPKRVADTVYFDRSLKHSSACSLIGNDHTLKTYPQWAHSKITRIRVSSAPTLLKGTGQYVGENKDYLWFSGSGAVHKGLDLVLEAFRELPELRLHVIGPVEQERDFWDIYKADLQEAENVKFHGFVVPESELFRQILKTCFCFISVSCSEGTSTSSTTCLQAGLYPILSVDNGIDLPPGAGRMVGDIGVKGLIEAVREVNQLSREEIEKQIAQTQDQALLRYTRQAFRNDMEAYFRQALGLHSGAES